MDKKLAKKAFIRYLKQKGVYAAYKKNFGFSFVRKSCPILANDIHTTNDFFELLNPCYYVSYAFLWSDANEEYWPEVGAEWYRIANSHDILSIIERCKHV